MFSSDSDFIHDFHEWQVSSNFTTKGQIDDEMGISWITIARAWALVVSMFGVPGNFITASTIIHQIFLHQRKQRLHSISDSCFHQMKVIKENNLSESSQSSSPTSVFQQKRSVFTCRKLSTGASKGMRDQTSVERTFHSDLFNSRESSPGIPYRNKYSMTVESSRSSPVPAPLKDKYSSPVESPKDVLNEKNFLQIKPSYDPYSKTTVSKDSAVKDDVENYRLPSNGQTDVNCLHSISREVSPEKFVTSPRKSVTPDRVSGNGTVNPLRGETATPNGDTSYSTSSSQTSKLPSKSVIRKSNSIRSQQSLSLNRFDAGTIVPNTYSIMRVEGDTILILHIILCDLLYCALSLPHTYYVYGFHSVNGSSPILCKEAAFLRYVNAFAEWMTLGLLAIQRCIDLAKPPNARFFKMKSTIYFVIGIWVLSTILQVGNLINHNFTYNNVTKKCDYSGKVTSMLYFYSLDSFLPCSLMIFGCISIILQIVRNKRRLQKFGMSEEVVSLREREMWQSACLVLSLLLLFLMCVIPICIFNLLFTCGVIENSEIGVILYMMYWLQYGINFIVYATSKRKFRIAYKSFFTVICMQFKRCCHINICDHDVEAIDDF